MYAVRFIHKSKVQSDVAPADLPWTVGVHRFETEQAANDECAWLGIDDGEYIYEPVEVAA
jgi:hypothetical protein